MTVRSACSRKWSMGSGSTFSIAATTSSAGSPASSFRAGEAIAPRPDHTQRVRLGQQVADGVGLQAHGPAGAPPDHRARRCGGVDARSRAAGRPARPAAAAGPAVPRSRTANPTAPHRVCRPARGFRSAPACPAGPATSTPAGAIWTPSADSTNRSAATVGAQYGPDAVVRVGFREARRRSAPRPRPPRGSGRAGARRCR